MANGMAPMQTMTMLGADFSQIMSKNYDAVRNAHSSICMKTLKSMQKD